MNTSNSNKLKFLAALSILLLMAVLIYWNADNYRRASLELKQDLSDQMSLASSVYRDSIVQNLFRMIEFRTEGDSITVMNRFDLREDTMMQRMKSSRGVTHSSEFTLSVNSIDEVKIEGGDNIPDTSIRVMYDHIKDRKIIVWDSDLNELPSSITVDPEPVKGVDIITGLALDTLVVFNTHGGKHEGFIPRLYLKIDSIFSDKLESAEIHLEHQLVLIDRSEDTLGLPEISVPLEYGNILDNKRPYVVFANYKKYLLNRIMPTLLMSIVLLLFVGMSFFIILRSWIAQDRLTQVKNEFVSNMTHELKTPISTIGVALEAFESFGAIQDPIRRKEYLEISKHEVNRLKILVDKVLKMSTLDLKEELVLTSKVDLKILMDEMLKSMKLHLDKNHAILNYTVQGADFVVLGEKVHLTNVLYNLLDNAIKYSANPPKISVDIVSQKSNVNIIISDEGIGVPKEYESRVFERFFRVPTKDRHNVKGHGLGLHYVKTIIDKHHGTVTFKNRSSVGSRLTITIPKAHD